MLTGDKLETATCTAKNAHLVTRNQDIHVFRPVSVFSFRSLHLYVYHSYYYYYPHYLSFKVIALKTGGNTALILKYYNKSHLSPDAS